MHGCKRIHLKVEKKYHILSIFCLHKQILFSTIYKLTSREANEKLFEN